MWATGRVGVPEAAASTSESVRSILALVACGAVPIAALAHASWAQALGHRRCGSPPTHRDRRRDRDAQLAPLEWYRPVVTFATLAIELAIPVLLLAGAGLAPQVRHDRFGRARRSRCSGAHRLTTDAHCGNLGQRTEWRSQRWCCRSPSGLPTRLVGSIVGLVLGYVSRNQMQRSRGAQGGAGLATASIVIGWAGVVLAAAAVVVYAVLLQ